MTRGLICSIKAARLDSDAAISFAVSFAVLLFEPHTAMPPRNEATEAAMKPEIRPDCTYQRRGQNQPPAG
jgi:hypothetical protein